MIKKFLFIFRTIFASTLIYVSPLLFISNATSAFSVEDQIVQAHEVDNSLFGAGLEVLSDVDDEENSKREKNLPASLLIVEDLNLNIILSEFSFRPGPERLFALSSFRGPALPPPRI